MKQQLLAVALFTSITSGATFAEDYSGFRLGVGAVSGQELTFDGITTNSGNRAKIEAGYDFNRVFAINGSVTAFSGAGYSESGDGTNAGSDIRGRDVRLEAEMGYAFNLAKGWDIKPYVAVGSAFINGTKRGFIGGSASAPQTELNSFKGTYLTTAAGVRLNTPVDVYVDLRVQKINMNDQQKANSVIKDNSQAALAVGIKF
ncbi:outer membrane beta-barrel protein [Vibrio maritimus]|uniref:outer membrane beta-barrel protein n=1 Tax=Vibrio maritimus TaxID=990268 RepID=UPI001F341F6D|nr:outer membrane beta-barrel protein [Vibrio maritimus]